MLQVLAYFFARRAVSFNSNGKHPFMISVLVMGAGLIGGRHIAAIKENPNCRLAGIIENDEARAEGHDAPVYSSIARVDSHVDAIVIATPTANHAAHAAQAARRGWHMLIEKPVVARPGQARGLLEILEKTGVKCLVGHHRRYHPQLQWLRRTIASGAIGTPVGSTMIWSMRKPEEYFQDNWRTQDGSPVMINLIHDIDAVRFVLGDIVDVQTIAGPKFRASDRVESGAVVMRLASGVCATMSFADNTPSPWGFEAGTGENPYIAHTGQDMWWITGSKGAVSFPSLTLWTGADNWGQAPQPAPHLMETVTPLAAQLDHFLAVIEGGSEPLITARDAARSLEVAHRIEKSLARRS